MFNRSREKNKPSTKAPLVTERPASAGAGKQGLRAASGAASAAGTRGGAGADGGKLAYEARRAAKAGVSLEKWMADKQKRVQAEQEAEKRDRQKLQPAKPPGLLKRLLDRAHKPL